MTIKIPRVQVLTPSIAMALGLAMAGCASTPAPYAQMTSAKVAIQEADSAGAGTLAPLELRNANKKLAEARQAFDGKQYDRARRLAEEAQVDAKLAETRARTAKAQQAVDELRDSIATLKSEIDRARKP